MQITPAILAHTADEAFARLFHSDLPGQPMFHLDVLDGSLFGATCFADPKVIAAWSPLPKLELHLMVNHPLRVLEAWLAQGIVPAQVIVHAEITHPITPTLSYAQQHGSKTLLAISGDTVPDDALPCLPLIQEFLVMGVPPGGSGRDFLGEPALAKVRRLRKLFPNIPVAVDGGVSHATLPEIAKAGATRCVVGSAIWQSWSPQQAFLDLQQVDL